LHFGFNLLNRFQVADRLSAIAADAEHAAMGDAPGHRKHEPNTVGDHELCGRALFRAPVLVTLEENGDGFELCIAFSTTFTSDVLTSSNWGLT
jgi:hypothetical protein